jgi:hypothetical protein
MAAWATVAELKRVFERLQFAYSGTWSDAELDALILRKQDDFEGDTRRKFSIATYTDERYDGNGRERMVLNQYPVVVLSSVVFLSGSHCTNEAVDLSAFWLDASKGVLVLLQGCCQDCFPEGVRNVSVTYSAGYASIPNTIKEAILKAAALEAITATPSRHQIDGVKSLRILNYSVSYNGSYSDLFEGWKADYEKAVDGFKRIYL